MTIDTRRPTHTNPEQDKYLLWDYAVNVVQGKLNTITSSRENFGGYLGKVRGLVLHLMEGTYSGTAGHFGSSRQQRLDYALRIWDKGGQQGPQPTLNSVPGPSSTHFGVAQDGRIARYVDIRTQAYHCGNTTVEAAGWPAIMMGQSNGKALVLNPNAYTLSIEHEGTYLAGTSWAKHTQMLESSAMLGALVLYLHSVVPSSSTVAGHRQLYAKKTCPGALNVGDWIIAANLNYAWIDKAVQAGVDPQSTTRSREMHDTVKMLRARWTG